jgi:hypothetical protein
MLKKQKMPVYLYFVWTGNKCKGYCHFSNIVGWLFGSVEIAKCFVETMNKKGNYVELLG